MAEFTTRTLIGALNARRFRCSATMRTWMYYETQERHSPSATTILTNVSRKHSVLSPVVTNQSKFALVLSRSLALAATSCDSRVTRFGLRVKKRSGGARTGKRHRVADVPNRS